MVKDVGTSGRDFYESLYASELEQEVGATPHRSLQC